MYNSVHFNKFMELCNCHYVLENFHQPQKTFHIHLHSVPTLQIFFFFKYSAFHLRTLGVRWRRDLREVSTESGSVSLPSFIPSIHHTLFIEHLVCPRMSKWPLQINVIHKQCYHLQWTWAQFSVKKHCTFLLGLCKITFLEMVM